MDALRRASQLVRLYAGKQRDLADRLQFDADGLREVLVSTITEHHPERPGDIPMAKYEACKKFLAAFDNIYSLNYDLLLYWTMMQEKIEPRLTCDDGFRQPEEGPQDYVAWDSSAHSQCVHYLHGALHIYEAGPETQKYTWGNTQIPLIERVRSALAAGKYPLFIAEGESAQKMSRIIRSSVLGRAYRSLGNIGGTLFIYGMPVGNNDAHIFRAIARSKVHKIWISVYGDPASSHNQQMTGQARQLGVDRVTGKHKRPLIVSFFDAASAQVWG